VVYTLEQDEEQVSLDVFDVNGRLVHRLSTGSREAGEYAVEWTGEDSHGRSVPSGVYPMRLVAGDRSRSLRVIRLE
jgi:flagellar hook assembly protein FlgD